MARRRKKWLWADAAIAQVQVNAGARLAADLTSPIRAQVPSLANYTVTGIFGELSFKTTAASQSNSIFHALTVVTAQAMVAGATAIPDPADDFAPWLYWMASGISGRTTAGDGDIRIPFHVASKRRMDETDMRLAFSMTNHSGDNILMQAWFRFLIDQR